VSSRLLHVSHEAKRIEDSQVKIRGRLLSAAAGARSRCERRLVRSFIPSSAWEPPWPLCPSVSARPRRRCTDRRDGGTSSNNPKQSETSREWRDHKKASWGGNDISEDGMSFHFKEEGWR